MLGVLRKFRDGLRRTRGALFGPVGGIFGAHRLDDATLEELEEALFGADFGVATTSEIMAEIRHLCREEKDLRGADAARLGAAVLTRVLAGSEGRLPPTGHDGPDVVCLVGVNGSGKTTTAAKLAHLLEGEGRSVLVGACDTFRAAANEQIRTWSERLGLELVASQRGADAASVAFDAYQAAVSRKRNILILDTAGRLHTKSNLMRELRKIRQVLQRQHAQAPQHAWLVLDASIGSNSIEQARVFHREFGLTGLVVTKLDGTSRGGALVGVFRELGLPIYFVGVGERADDLVPFSVRDYANAVFALEDSGDG